MKLDFGELLNHFTDSVEVGDGGALAGLFTPNGTYHDTFYGLFHGRSAIANMLEKMFWGNADAFKWEMFDPVFNKDAELGYSRWVFSYTSTMEDSAGKRVVFDGMSQFIMRKSQILHYREVFSAGLGLVQLDMNPARTDKILRRMVDVHLKDPEWARHAVTKR
jgi:hypothetical protein